VTVCDSPKHCWGMDRLVLSSSGYETSLEGISIVGDEFGEISTGFELKRHWDKQS